MVIFDNCENGTKFYFTFYIQFFQTSFIVLGKMLDKTKFVELGYRGKLFIQGLKDYNIVFNGQTRKNMGTHKQGLLPSFRFLEIWYLSFSTSSLICSGKMLSKWNHYALYIKRARISSNYNALHLTTSLNHLLTVVLDHQCFIVPGCCSAKKQFLN